MLLVDVLELTVERRRIFVSHGTLDTIDQSRRARLSGRAELFWDLRHKTVRALRVDKEADVQGICEGVEHHLQANDSHPAYMGIGALRSSNPVPRCTAGVLGEWLFILENLLHQLL